MQRGQIKPRSGTTGRSDLVIPEATRELTHLSASRSPRLPPLLAIGTAAEGGGHLLADAWHRGRCCTPRPRWPTDARGPVCGPLQPVACLVAAAAACHPSPSRLLGALGATPPTRGSRPRGAASAGLEGAVVGVGVMVEDERELLSILLLAAALDLALQPPALVGRATASSTAPRGGEARGQSAGGGHVGARPPRDPAPAHASGCGAEGGRCTVRLPGTAA